MDLGINSLIHFNFSTPGARSLGLGGAFVGLADDATAAFTNPAGLTILSQPEVSLEGRSWSYSHEVPFRGHAFGPPTQIGVDTISGVQTRDFEDDISALSFVSFVYPRGRWSFAAYRHVSADFEANVESEGLFADALFPGLEEFGELPGRFFPLRGVLDLEIVNYGVSTGFRVSENLSIGLGASYYEFEIDSRTRRFDIFGTDDVTAPGGFFGPPDFSAGNLVSSQVQVGDDTDVAAIGGLLWKINSRWSLGAVYRQGPSFEFDARTLFPDGSLFSTSEFNVPDVYAVGIAYRPTDALALTLDYDRVEYSALLGNPSSILGRPATPEEQAAYGRLELDDADEVHLGLEYVWGGLRYPTALRLGAYHDPAHRIHFDGAPDNSPLQRGLATQFREGDDDIHYSVGLGVVFDQFQVDAAADFSDLLETFSLSGVYRFGG